MPSSSACVAMTASRSCVEEPALDLATLLSGVAGAVRQYAIGLGAVAVFEAAVNIGVDELRRLARRGEADRARAGEHGLGDHVAGLGEGAAPLARDRDREGAGSRRRSYVRDAARRRR